MLIPIIKDLNNSFSYLLLTSSGKIKELFDYKSFPVVIDPKSDGSLVKTFSEFVWAMVHICFLTGINAIKYVVSFQWLRDFAYLPISIPTTFRLESLPQFFSDYASNNNENKLFEIMFNGGKIVMPFTTQNFLLEASESASSLHSWSLSFLCNDWFDPLTTPLNFLSSNNLSQGQSSSFFMASNFLQNHNNGTTTMSHHTIMIFLICMCTGFSSFFNSFFCGFPFSLSTILSLRYLIIQKFLAGCLSVLGIVLGEMTFMLFLILPPPFIQISLFYLESFWPHVLGLGLIIFIVIDIVSNPYNNSLSLTKVPYVSSFQTNYQSKENIYTTVVKKKYRAESENQFQESEESSQVVSKSGDQRQSKKKKVFQFIKRIFNKFMFSVSNISPIYVKIFFISFLLSFTEESCIFSFFGSLNLSSTANFLDTYIFSASQYPPVLVFSCIGFVFGSFLALITYNYIIAKLIFLCAHSGTYYVNRIKNYGIVFLKYANFLPSDSNTSTDFNAPTFEKPRQPLFKNENNGLYKHIFVSVVGFLMTIKNLLIYCYHLLLMCGLTIANAFIRFFNSFLHAGKIVFSKKQFFKPHTLENDDNLKKPLNNNAFLSSLEKSVENSFHNLNFGFYRFPSTATSSVMGDSSLNNPLKQSSLNVSRPRLMNKIDKILLTVLISLSFTTIPYYSFDYLVNNVFGFIPQDQLLNTISLRVNFPDYTSLLGVTVSDKNSVMNTDISLYDRAHFMYGEWPNSFESFNYQGELMWNNARDHRRQKRTRRSTRLKFKTLKTKISTSWKEFKKNSEIYKFKNNSLKDPSNNNSLKDPDPINNNNSLNDPNNNNSLKDQTLYNSLDSNNSLKDQTLYNSLDSNNNNYSSLTNQNINMENSFNFLDQRKNLSMRDHKNQSDEKTSLLDIKSFSINQAFNSLKTSPHIGNLFETNNRKNVYLKNPLNKTIHSNFIDNSFSKDNTTIVKSMAKPNEIISPSSFTDLSGGEKLVEVYPNSWKKTIIEKYYNNPLYKKLLSWNINPLLKREPKNQQLTINQENELYFLRMKMAHYYDSLRYIFSLKTNSFLKKNIFQRKPFHETSINNSLDANNETNNQNSPRILSEETLKNVDDDDNNNDNDDYYDDKTLMAITSKKPWLKKELFKENKNKYPAPSPFKFKSISSMNYRQQFKGTLKTVKELFAISLHNNDILPQTTKKDTIHDTNNFDNDDDEKFYNYDKYLFNEEHINNNSFSHEETKQTNYEDPPVSSDDEAKQTNFENPSVSSDDEAKQTNFQNSPVFPNNDNTSTMNEIMNEMKSTSSTQMNNNEQNTMDADTKIIYNMLGSHDPFYVGWDQNLRKFVLTSRILPTENALNSYDKDQPIINNTNKNLRYSLFTNVTDNDDNNDYDNDYDDDDGNYYKKYDKKYFAQHYRHYTCWPLFKHQLNNDYYRPYSISEENYENVLDKKVHFFENLNNDDLDTKALSFLYNYSSRHKSDKVKQLPINIYKQIMKPTTLENLFTPISTARSSFLWPGAVKPLWEYALRPGDPKNIKPKNNEPKNIEPTDTEIMETDTIDE